MNEPSYSGGSEGTGTMEQPLKRATPSKKAFMLKTLSTPRRKLSAQGGGMEMLPPGNSVRDPHYSVKVGRLGCWAGGGCGDGWRARTVPALCAW
jgi:hypothetical protein